MGCIGIYRAAQSARESVRLGHRRRDPVRVGESGLQGLHPPFQSGSFYTGTLAAGAIIVLWVYYAALVFVLGGEVGQVYELRRIRRLQHHHAQ